MGAYQVRTEGLCSLVVSFLLCGGVFNLPVTAQGKKAVYSNDVIIFKNGDQLTGALLRAVGNTVVFKSDMVAEVTVPISRVKELRSRGSFAVLKKHENIAFTTVQPGDSTLSNNSI